MKVYEPKYETVKIGNQVWATKNFDTDHFRNGDLISESITKQEWINSDLSEEPSWCYYDFDPENGKKFGKLYNFHTIHDPRGLSPENFSIPTLDDFSQLIDFVEKEKNEMGFKDWIKNYYYIFDIYSNVNKSKPPIITKLFLKLFPKQY